MKCFARPRSRAGFTLIELLLVIALVALVLGFSLGTITRLDLGENVALAEVQNTIRQAHNWALAQRSPARARIDPATGAMRAEGLLTVGTWRFEGEPLQGAFGVDASRLGGKLVSDGYHGQAISFAGEPPRSRVEIPLQLDPACDPTEGFRLACAVRTTEDGAGSVLRFGDSIGIETYDDGSVSAWFAPATPDSSGDLVKGGKLAVRSGPHVLRAGRWAELLVAYDRRELTLSVDQTRVALRRDDAPVWKPEGPLVLSPDNQVWPGAIDDLVFAIVQAGDELVLPSSVTFAKDAPKEIRFVSGGGLDRDLHPEPVVVTIVLKDGRTQSTTVNLFGTVE